MYTPNQPRHPAHTEMPQQTWAPVPVEVEQARGYGNAATQAALHGAQHTAETGQPRGAGDEPTVVVEATAALHGDDATREMPSLTRSNPMEDTLLGGELTAGDLGTMVEQAKYNDAANRSEAALTDATQVMRLPSRPSTGKLTISNGVGHLQYKVGERTEAVLDPYGRPLELEDATRAHQAGGWTFVDGKMLVTRGPEGQKLALNAAMQWVEAPGWWTRRKIQRGPGRQTTPPPTFASGRAMLPPQAEPQLYINASLVGTEPAPAPERTLVAVGQPTDGEPTLEHTVVDTGHAQRSAAWEPTRVEQSPFRAAANGKGRREARPTYRSVAGELYGTSRGLTGAQQVQVNMILQQRQGGRKRRDGAA